MKYKIEIWRYHSIVDTYQSKSLNKILRWYNKNWKQVYEFGGCTFYVFGPDTEIKFDELYDLGFYD